MAYSREILVALEAYIRDQPYPLDAPADLDHFERSFHRQGLLGALAWQVIQHGHSDAHFVKWCKGAFAGQFFQAAQYLALVERINQALAEASVEILLLKGAALNQMVYARPGIRHISDLDFLVRQGQLESVREIIRGLDFASSPESNTLVNGKGLVIDLHHPELGVAECYAGLRADLLWSRSTQHEALSQIRLPDITNQLQYTALHALKHSYSRKVWLLDLWLLRAKMQSPVECLPGTVKAVDYSSHLLDLVAGLPTPALLPFFERRIVEGMLFHDLHPMGQLLVALHLPDWASRISCLKSLFFHQATDDSEHFGRRFVRIISLIARGLIRTFTAKIDR